MLKKILSSLGVLALVMSASYAKNHKVISLTTQQSKAEKVVLATRWADSLTVSHIEEATLVVQWYERNSSGFRASSSTPVDLSLMSPYISNVNNYTLHDVAMDLQYSYVLSEGEICTDDADCTDRVLVLSAHNKRGAVVSGVLGEEGYVSLETNCDSTPALLRAPEGVWVFDGCGKASFYTPGGVGKTIQLDNWDESSVVMRLPWYEFNDGVIHPTENDLFWMVGSHSENEFSSVSYNAEGEMLSTDSFLLPESSSQCAWVPGQSRFAVGCLINDNVTLVEGVEGKPTFELTLNLRDDDLTIEAQSSWAAFNYGEHTIVGRSALLRTVDDDEDETNNVSYEGWRISNYNTSSSIRYQGYAAGDLDEALKSKHMGPYEIDPTGYYAATLVNANAGEWVISLYDTLPTDEDPYWLQSIGGTLSSGQSFSHDLFYEDDNVAYEDIPLTPVTMPSWSAIKQESIPYQFSGEVGHAHAGSWPVRLELGNTGREDGSFVLSSEYQILLSSYRVLFYEPTLFDRLGLDEPIPLSSLLSSLKKLDVLEDKPFIATLSLDGRVQDEVELSFEEMPGFLSWDPESMTLSGTPEQMDVSLYDGFSVLTQDDYAELDDETGLPVVEKLKTPLNVIEVDDLFEVHSSGGGTVAVGEFYEYQLIVVDEESAMADLSVTLSSEASWLSYHKDKFVLSGTPDEEDEGRPFVVQLTITDQGGHTVLQTFTINVEALAEDKSGGSISVRMLLMCVVLLCLRRRTALV